MAAVPVFDYRAEYDENLPLPERLTMEQYRRVIFRPDAHFIYGQITARNLGDSIHSPTIGLLISKLHPLAKPSTSIVASVSAFKFPQSASAISPFRPPTPHMNMSQQLRPCSPCLPAHNQQLFPPTKSVPYKLLPAPAIDALDTIKTKDIDQPPGPANRWAFAFNPRPNEQDFHKSTLKPQPFKTLGQKVPGGRPPPLGALVHLELDTKIATSNRL